MRSSARSSHVRAEEDEHVAALNAWEKALKDATSEAASTTVLANSQYLKSQLSVW